MRSLYKPIFTISVLSKKQILHFYKILKTSISFLVSWILYKWFCIYISIKKCPRSKFRKKKFSKKRLRIIQFLFRPKRSLKRSIRKSKFKTLTKKQKKKIRMAKANKIIYPGSNLFIRKGAGNRHHGFNHNFENKELFVHDGYSWSLCKPSLSFVGHKLGCFAFKTRSLSPISLEQKIEGTVRKMAQTTTYKISSPKVKRKK